jgi:hypothetical protein
MGTDLSQHFRTCYGPNLERKHGEVTPVGRPFLHLAPSTLLISSS